jgi:DNA-directed RNA polymerase subunit omega
MARITIEDCLEKVDNRFSLVHLAARRVRQLRAGSKVMSDRNNKDVVLSLREIAAGQITAENIDDFNPRHQDELLLTDNEDDDEGLL